jgi:hypothetical protein
MHFLDFAVFTELAVKIFVKGIEMGLDLVAVQGVALHVFGVLVDVSAEDGLGEVWADVFAGTLVTEG